MKNGKLNAIVGLFVLVGIICLAYLSIRLGRLELFDGEHYTIRADFDSVAGLKEGATVEIAGVQVGHVDRITLGPQNARARVYLALRREVRLQEDTIASVRTRGIIGDKVIVLKPGGSERLLGAGGAIRETEGAVDLEELISKYVHGQVE
ncbi:MAG TPA: outer membrane lipid asymmetry maintenance protein MlaD [Geobacter sp.]|nr:outer membrane lipid asymmetry maintenance protein MlaD [Geobacter sp.]